METENTGISFLQKVLYTIFFLVFPVLGFFFFWIFSKFLYKLSPNLPNFIFDNVGGHFAAQGYFLLILLAAFLLFIFLCWFKNSKKIVLLLLVVSFLSGFFLLAFFIENAFNDPGTIWGAPQPQFVTPCTIDSDGNPLNGCQGY
jgi:hypothetical protein